MSRRPTRWRLVLLGVSVAAALAVVAGAALHGTLVYYRTPSQVEQTAPGQQVRVGGEVVPGSLHADASGVSFVLSDGRATTPVRSSTLPSRSFREGQDAVVEGALDPDGVFVATSVMVRHSNEYRAPGSPSQVQAPAVQ